jgi:hypothetical protein
MKIIKIKDCFNCNYVSYVGSTTVARWQCTKKMENGYFIQFDKANNVIDPRCPLDDYDEQVVKNCNIPAVIKSVCDDCTAYPFDERGKTPLCKTCKDNPSQTVL